MQVPDWPSKLEVWLRSQLLTILTDFTNWTPSWAPFSVTLESTVFAYLAGSHHENVNVARRYLSTIASGCSAIGRAVASNNRSAVRIQPSSILFTIKCYWKDENKEKEGWNGPIF